MSAYLMAVCKPLLPDDDQAELRVEHSRSSGVTNFVVIAPSASGGRLVGTRGWIAKGIRVVADAYARSVLGWERDEYNVNVKRTKEGA